MDSVKLFYSSVYRDGFGLNRNSECLPLWVLSFGSASHVAELFNGIEPKLIGFMKVQD